MKKLLIMVIGAMLLWPSAAAAAKGKAPLDTDLDGLIDSSEIKIYKTDPSRVDTDGDGYTDGEEVLHNYDPNSLTDERMNKRIEVTLKNQTLAYFHGPYQINAFKISGGLKKTPTPTGDFTVDKKLPVNLYKGPGYYYPKTKYNLRFLYHPEGSYYIHGAYWHNAFGTPRSHGCVNVSYANMAHLYEWAEVGTPVSIR